MNQEFKQKNVINFIELIIEENTESIFPNKNGTFTKRTNTI